MADATTSQTQEAQVAKATSATGRGTTIIGETVVSKVADAAAREIQGVIDLVGGVGGTLRRLTPGLSERGSGADVEVGRRETIIELNIVAAFGISIPQMAEAVRANVIEQIEYATGLEVKEVNIEISDVAFPSESRVE